METKQQSPESKKVYSPEKNQKFSALINGLRLKAYRTLHEEELNKELFVFDSRLKEKYNVMQYAMIHSLRGSTVHEQLESTILYEDFPGEDSVEKFINYLVEKYSRLL